MMEICVAGSKTQEASSQERNHVAHSANVEPPKCRPRIQSRSYFSSPFKHHSCCSDNTRRIVHCHLPFLGKSHFWNTASYNRHTSCPHSSRCTSLPWSITLQGLAPRASSSRRACSASRLATIHSPAKVLRLPQCQEQGPAVFPWATTSMSYDTIGVC
jgi:hypothetical protein